MNEFDGIIRLKGNNSEVNKSSSICIITSECVGPFKNGGIGTSMTGLAELLAKSGHHVTLLYTRGFYLTASEVKKWTETYQRDGVRFIALRPSDMCQYSGVLSLTGYITPSVILNFLNENIFDIVHFNDTDGEGYLSIAAHALGEAFPDTVFVVGVHSPRQWVSSLNRIPHYVPADTYMREAEKISLELADVVWCPSKYLIDWVKSNNWKLADQLYLQQYIMPDRLASDDEKNPKNEQKEDEVDNQFEPNIRKIAFFGRLEERKGLRIFLDSVDRLLKTETYNDIEVIFLGRSVAIDGKSSKEFIKENIQDWKIDHKIITDLGKQDAVNYLKENRILAIIASPADNSPCTVYEVMEENIPFIAARTGGIPELIHPDDHDKVLFDYRPESLEALLKSVLTEGIRNIKPAIKREDNAKRWIEFHNIISANNRPKIADDSIDICLIIEDNDPNCNLNDTLDNIETSNKDIIVISSNKSREPSISTNCIFVLPTQAKEYIDDYFNTKKNVAALCVYSGIKLIPSSLDKLLSSIATQGIEAVSPSARLTRSDLKCDSPVGTVATVFNIGPASTGAVFLSPTAVSKGISISSDYDAGHFGGLIDRAVVSGVKIYPLPIPLIVRTSNRLAMFKPPMTIGRLRLYSKAENDDIQPLIQLAAGMSENILSSFLRYLAYRMIQSRFGILFPYVLKLGTFLHMYRGR